MNFYKESPHPILSKYDIEFFTSDRELDPFEVEAHIHSAIEILYFTKGRFEVTINGSSFTANVGDLVLVRSNAIHSIKYPKDKYGEYYVLKISTRYLIGIFENREKTDCLLAFLKNKRYDKALFEQGSIPNELKSILNNMINEYNHGDDMMLSVEKGYAGIFAITMFRTLLNDNNAHDEVSVNSDIIALIHQSVEYINLNYGSELSASNCAKKLNLSYSYYAKLFRQIIGKSFKEYLTDIRMAKAQNILLATDYPVTDVALSCGYNSHAHFTAEYKKYYGKTPSQTRKSPNKVI